MDSTATCSTVNGLLVDIHRSLLQYAAEAEPWAAEGDEAVQKQFQASALDQERIIEKMVEFLRSRKQIVDFGVYPQEYTSLHFVSVDYFLTRLKESQAGVISELETAVGQLAGDLEAVQLVESAIEVNQQILRALNETKLASQA